MGAFTSCFHVPADDHASNNTTSNSCFFQRFINMKRKHNNSSSDGKVDLMRQDDDIVGLNKKSISDNINYEREDHECPTCLEEYSEENPKIIAKCSHHFHLSCIYEWMERSTKCPICGKIMLFDE